jgi:soluble lytic murein transglycosylase-like protein
MMVAIRPKAGRQEAVAHAERNSGAGLLDGTQDRTPLTNKKVYICSVAFLTMLAASPTRAASPAPNDAPPAPTAVRKEVVVRANRRTGKLVRAVVSLPARANDPAPAPSAGISEIVEQAARDNHVDPLLVHSVIQVESNYNPYAISSKGAEGLMQLMPPTARDLGVSDSFDPRQNIEAGVRYLKYLQDLYKDDRLALAAYNAGPAAVAKYKSVPPYPETQNYVDRVGQRYAEAKQAATRNAPSASAGVAPEPAATVPAVEEEKPPKLEQFVDADGRLHLRTVPQ